MADNLNIYRNCQSCGGDGKQDSPRENDSPVEVECKGCGGSGEYLWGHMREEE